MHICQLVIFVLSSQFIITFQIVSMPKKPSSVALQCSDYLWRFIFVFCLMQFREKECAANTVHDQVAKPVQKRCSFLFTLFETSRFSP